MSKSDKQGSDKITWEKQGTSYQSPSNDTPMAEINFDTGLFKNRDVNPGGTLELLFIIYFCSFPQGSKSFESWPKKVTNSAK